MARYVESLPREFYPSILCRGSRSRKCELRDVIHSLLSPLWTSQLTLNMVVFRIAESTPLVLGYRLDREPSLSGAPCPHRLLCSGSMGVFFLALTYLSCYISYQLGGNFGLLLPSWHHSFSPPHRSGAWWGFSFPPFHAAHLSLILFMLNTKYLLFY